MIDLATVSQAKSITIRDLKKRPNQVYREVVEEGQVYVLSFGDREDVAIVSLEGLLELASEHAGPLKLAARLQRKLAALTGVPLAGGPEEDDLPRVRCSEPRISGSEVLAATRAKLGLE